MHETAGHEPITTRLVNEVEVENVNAEPGKEYVYTIETEINDVNLSQDGFVEREDGLVMIDSGASVNVCRKWFGNSSAELNLSREGEAWILLWDVASIQASTETLAAMRATFPRVMRCFILPRSTSYLQPCDVAVFRSFKSCIQTQASATLARSVLDGSFEFLAMNKAWRRRSSAEWRLAQSRTSATKTRCGRLVGVACAPTTMPTSKKPPQRPRHSTPTMSSSPSTSSRSPLLKTPYSHLSGDLHASCQPSSPSACHEMVLFPICVKELEHIAASRRRVLQDVP